MTRGPRIVDARPAGPDHQVLSVEGGRRTYRRRPCGGCPWRVDQTVQRKHGKTPAELRNAAEAARDEALAVLARTYDALTELMEYCTDPGPNAFGAIWQAQRILPAKTGPADPWPARFESVTETARAVRVELDNAEEHTDADTVVMAAVRELLDALHHVLPGGTGA